MADRIYYEDECPECDGRGFLEEDVFSVQWGHDTFIHECRRCRGEGVVLGPRIFVPRRQFDPKLEEELDRFFEAE